MGGVGSGKYFRHSARDTVESRRAIDVRKLKKDGCLEPGKFFTQKWTYWDGATSSTINIRVEIGKLFLEYQTKEYHEKEWSNVVEPISLDWSPCHFGRDRPWFVCPSRSCRKRSAKLFSGRGGYLCRKCQNLAYESTRENDGFRAMSRAQAIRIKLGGSGSLHSPFPDKPKGMHWRTYEKMAGDAHRNSSIGFEAMAEQQEKLENILNRMVSTT